MSGSMMGEWGGGGSDLASAQLYLQLPTGTKLVLWYAIHRVLMVKYCHYSIFHCSRVSNVGPNGKGFLCPMATSTVHGKAVHLHSTREKQLH